MWPSPGSTLGLKREPRAGAAAPKALPQQEEFTVHDICTMDGTATITKSEKTIKEKWPNFSEMKISTSLPYIAYENILKNHEKQ